MAQKLEFVSQRRQAEIDRQARHENFERIMRGVDSGSYSREEAIELLTCYPEHLGSDVSTLGELALLDQISA